MKLQRYKQRERVLSEGRERRASQQIEWASRRMVFVPMRYAFRVPNSAIGSPPARPVLNEFCDCNTLDALTVPVTDV